MIFFPDVSNDVWTIAPGFRALSLHVQRSAHAPCDASVAANMLQNVVDSVHSGDPAWQEAHLAAWDDVFRRFGAKPQRTPCSARSLRDRVLKTGTLGSIDPVVDLYNAVSLAFAVPVGGENAGAYAGSPRLVVADGSEAFDTMKNGAPAIEQPDKGEVVWRDEVGVTCRRWNWRQGVRTRLDASVTEMWFVLESLPEMPLASLQEAGEMLVDGLRRLFGRIEASTMLLQQEDR